MGWCRVKGLKHLKAWRCSWWAPCLPLVPNRTGRASITFPRVLPRAPSMWSCHMRMKLPSKMLSPMLGPSLSPSMQRSPRSSCTGQVRPFPLYVGPHRSMAMLFFRISTCKADGTEIWAELGKLGCRVQMEALVSVGPTECGGLTLCSLRALLLCRGLRRPALHTGGEPRRAGGWLWHPQREGLLAGEKQVKALRVCGGLLVGDLPLIH